MKKSEKQPEAIQPKTKTCTKCNSELPIENFRTHKSGYILNQCRSCEKSIALARSHQAKKSTIATTEPATPSTTTFTITTKKGKEFQASLEPIPSGRKATNGENVLYFPAGTTRDEARSAFAIHFNCQMTGISTEVVQ